MGVGIFTEKSGPMHMFTSFFVFLFGGLSAIFSCRLMKHPFSIIGILLGLMSLLALILYIGNFYFGLGVGGMERMIVYQIMIFFEQCELKSPRPVHNFFNFRGIEFYEGISRWFGSPPVA